MRVSVDGRQLYPTLHSTWGAAVDAIDLDFIAASMLSTVNVYSSYLLYQNPETKIQKEWRIWIWSTKRDADSSAQVCPEPLSHRKRRTDCTNQPCLLGRTT